MNIKSVFSVCDSLVDGGSFKMFNNKNELNVEDRDLVYISSQSHADNPIVLFENYTLIKNLHIADNYGTILKYLTISNCPLLTKIEIGKRVYSSENSDDSSILTIRDCSSLELILIGDYSFIDVKHFVLESCSYLEF